MPGTSLLRPWLLAALAAASRDEDLCELRLGQGSRAKRPDVPGRGHEPEGRPSVAPLEAVSLDYAWFDSQDFVASAEKLQSGLVLRPRQRKSMALYWQALAGAGIGDEFWLEGLQLRTPSEHTVDGVRYAGELQAFHRNDKGDMVVVSALFNGMPRYVHVGWKEDCPGRYREIDTQDHCKLAAVQMGYMSQEDAFGGAIVSFEDAHRLNGCMVVLEKATNTYQVLLDPEVGDIFAADYAMALCDLGDTVVDWVHTVVHQEKEPAACSWISSLSDLDGHCDSKAKRMELAELWFLDDPYEQRFLHYRGNETNASLTRHSKYVVELGLNESSDVGFSASEDSNGWPVIGAIAEQGLIADRNAAGGHSTVQVGDRILEVNGIAGKAALLELRVVLAARGPSLRMTMQSQRGEGEGAREGPWPEQCPGTIDWFILTTPRAMDMHLLASTQVHQDNGELLSSWVERFPDSGVRDRSLSPVDIVVPQSPLKIAWDPLIEWAPWVGSGFVLCLTLLSGWALVETPSVDFEPDLVESTREARWALVREHGVAGLMCWFTIPFFLSAGQPTAADGTLEVDPWLPYESHMWVNFLVATHVLYELCYLCAAGSARQRLQVWEATILMMLDVISVLDAFFDLVFFCVAYQRGSTICWLSLLLFTASRLGWWLLGLLQASRLSEDTLLHWAPRYLGVMHQVVMQHLLEAELEEELKSRCAWLALPVLKGILEDIPQAFLQMIFAFAYGPTTLVWISILTSLFAATGAFQVALVQAKTLDLGFADIILATQEHLETLHELYMNPEDDEGSTPRTASQAGSKASLLRRRGYAVAEGSEEGENLLMGFELRS